MLHGSLDAFGLSDVFALLAATHKTGTLHVHGPRSEGWLEFHDGAVAYAVSNTRRMALASRLLGGGLVDDTQLRHLVAAQRGGAAALARVLLDGEVMDEERFTALVREQIQDAVFELLRSSEGEFSFDAAAPGGGVRAEDEVRLTVPTDQLVSEAERRLRDWKQIADHVVSVDAVVTLAPQPPAESGTVSMGAEQWRLLTFVDGRRTVRDLVDLTGVGEYATCQAVADLVDAGLLQVVDPSAGARTGVAELVGRHNLLRRLEERELTAAARPPAREEPPVRDEAPSGAIALGARVPEPAPELEPEPEPELEQEPTSALDDPDLVPLSQVLGEDPEPAPAAEPEPDLPSPQPPQPPREDETFARDEVERELASLGYRRAVRPEPEPELGEDDAESTDTYHPIRPEDGRGGGGLLSRLIDGRKQP